MFRKASSLIVTVCTLFPIFQRGEAHTSENSEPGWEQETSTAE